MYTARNNPNVVGHAAAKEAFLQALVSERLAHAWILAGERGIGKATFAYHAARCLLSHGSSFNGAESHPLLKRLDSGSHPDFMAIEPLMDEKKEEQKREISVDQVRGVKDFITHTAGESSWRVVIIDSIDELNNNAANALLKMLEEPPPRVVLLLVSHNPGKLLPTIRSRCRLLPFSPLKQEEYLAVMQSIIPELNTEQVLQLGVMGTFSPGVALELYALGAVEQYAAIVKLMQQLPALPAAFIQQMADQFGAKQPHTKWRAQGRMLSLFLERLVATAAGQTQREAVEGEFCCHAHLLRLRNGAFWVEWWGRAQEEFLLAERLHLDYKTVTIAFFERLRSQVSQHAYAA